MQLAMSPLLSKLSKESFTLEIIVEWAVTLRVQHQTMLNSYLRCLPTTEASTSITGDYLHCLMAFHRVEDSECILFSVPVHIRTSTGISETLIMMLANNVNTQLLMSKKACKNSPLWLDMKWVFFVDGIFSREN